MSAPILRQALRRSYATASGSGSSVKINSLTGTYATSTYLAALKKSPKDLETLDKDITAFNKKISDDVKVLAFIQNPMMSTTDRAKELPRVVGSGVSPILLNLLNVLSENGRLSSAPKVFADFSSLMAAYRGELEVVVTSAEALDQRAMQRLERALKGTEAAQGKTLKISNKINPSVMGGVLVDMGDKTIDLSAAAKVNRFNAALQRE